MLILHVSSNVWYTFTGNGDVHRESTDLWENGHVLGVGSALPGRARRTSHCAARENELADLILRISCRLQSSSQTRMSIPPCPRARRARVPQPRWLHSFSGGERARLASWMFGKLISDEMAFGESLNQVPHLETWVSRMTPLVLHT